MTRPSKIFWENNCPLKPMELSPVEKRQAKLPRGNGDWLGAEHVWKKLQEAAMGSGHEETMKYQLSIAYAYGWARTKD
jgi:hypothetical protein